MKRMFVLCSVIFTLGLLGASTAHAATVDFKSATFAPAAGQSTFTTTVNGFNITLKALSLPGTTLYNKAFYYDPVDGLGITHSYPSGDEADEIDNPEVFKIAFNSPTPVLVNSVSITDLFIETRNGNTYAETGLWSTDINLPLAQWNSFSQTNPAAPNGEFLLAINQSVSQLYFTSLTANRKYQDHDFSLAGLNLQTVVPEPSTYLLLGTFLVAAYAVHLRRRKALAMASLS